MAQTPFHLRYTLSRAQRLVPLVRRHGVLFTPFIVGGFLFFCVESAVSAWLWSAVGLVGFGGLALLTFVLHQELLVGLLEVLVVPRRKMDVVVEDEAAGILFGTERWYLFLDGITRLTKYRADTWTVQHYNGCVFHIPVSAITEEQLAHIRALMERGRTPEGMRAVIERGRRIQAIEEAQRRARRKA